MVEHRLWLTPGILPGLAGLFLIRHYGDDRLLWLFPAGIAAWGSWVLHQGVQRSMKALN